MFFVFVMSLNCVWLVPIIVHATSRFSHILTLVVVVVVVVVVVIVVVAVVVVVVKFSETLKIFKLECKIVHVMISVSK